VQRLVGYLNVRRFEEAAHAAAKLLQAHPKVAIIADALGYAQSELGQAEAAERNFRRAIGLDPKYAEARANFGQFLLRQGRYDEAIVELRETLRLLPELQGALINLGSALKLKFHYRQATPFLERAIRQDPEDLAARIELVECLLDDRRPSEAMNVLHPILDTVMSGAENRVLCARCLTEMQKPEEALAELEVAELQATQKVHARIAKATLLQTLGRFEEAEKIFRWVFDADPLSGRPYNTFLVTKKLAPDDPLIEKMRSAYDHPDLTEESRAFLGFALAKVMEDTKNYDRVFTYLRPANDQIRKFFPYDVSERIKAIERTQEHFRDVDFVAAAQRSTNDYSPIFVTGLPRSGTTLVEQIIASHSRVTGGGEMSAAYQVLSDADDDHRRSGRTSFDVSEPQLRKLGKTIETRMREAFPQADVITDKSVSTYNMIGLVKAVFPRSKIIVVRRDPRDLLLSMYKNNFAEGRHLYSNSLHDLGVYYHGFLGIMEFWQNKLPGSIHEIEYEALIADPETEARKLIAACDLEWEEQCLSFHENKRPVQTLSVHQVRQPLYSSSMKAWQRYESDLGELFDALGEPWLPKSSAGAG